MAAALLSAPPARAATNARLRVRYTASQRLDVYLPRPHARPVPAVVFVHGGGWSKGNRTWYRAQASKAAAHGWVGVTVDYRLAPAARFPAAVDDVHAAVRWVRAHARELNVDPARVALVGGSAGGNLAALAATTGAPVAAVVSWSGPMDLTTLGLGPLVRGYLGCTARACPPRARAASPIAHVDRADPPTLLINSSNEMVPAAQARTMAAALTRAHVANKLVIVPGRAHATQLGARAWRETVSFLDAQMGA